MDKRCYCDEHDHYINETVEMEVKNYWRQIEIKRKLKEEEDKQKERDKDDEEDEKNK